MLQVLRHKHVSKIIFWSLLILILPAFVLWGTGNLGGGKNKGPSHAGVINGKKVSFDRLNSNLISVRSQIILNYFNQPNILNSILSNKALMAKLAWDRMIMLDEVKKNKIKSDDKEIVAIIRNHPMFNRGGGFDEKVYEYVLRYNMGTTPRAFEETVRENLTIQKLNETLTKNVMATDEDTMAVYQKDNGKYTISYILFPLAEKMGEVKVPEQDIKDYYEKNKAQIAIKPKDPEDKSPQRLATYEEAKADIENFLAENLARKLAYDAAVEAFKKLSNDMEKDKLSFEDAAQKEGLKISGSPVISKTDKIAEIGEAPIFAEVLPMMKLNEISKPIPVQKGAAVVKLVGIEKIDEAAFAKEKDKYSKLALDMKKAAYLDNWLKGLEVKTTVNIDFNNLDKYFK